MNKVTKVIFQDFPGPGIFKKKDPGLSRRRGDPETCNFMQKVQQQHPSMRQYTDGANKVSFEKISERMQESNVYKIHK